MKKEKSRQTKPLSLVEIYSIYMMSSEGKSVREIARRIKRSPSAVSRTIKYRGHFNGLKWRKLSPFEKAEYLYGQRSRKQRQKKEYKLCRDEQLREYVLQGLTKDNWSPEQIAKKSVEKVPGKKVSTKTIYNYIKKRRSDLHKYLLEKGKPRRQRVVHRRGRLKQAAPAMRSIHERPEEVETRDLAGDWEGDLVILKNGCLLSLREIKTLRQIIRLLPDKKAETVREALKDVFKVIPDALKRSITLDRGGEFTPSELGILEKIYEGLKLYYCDAYKPYQKGSVEQGHRWMRWYFPRNTDALQLTSAEITRVENIINNKPLKKLGFKSPTEVWNELEKIAA